MNDADTSPDEVVIECELEAPPETVWRALTEPQLLAAWLIPEEPQQQPGPIECEVLAAEPHRFLRLSWRGSETEWDAEGQPLDSVVTFELTRSASGGTHLRLVHSGLGGTAHPALAMAA